MDAARLIPVDEGALLFGVSREESAGWIERGLVPNAAGPEEAPGITPESLREFLLRLLDKPFSPRALLDHVARTLGVDPACDAGAARP